MLSTCNLTQNLFIKTASNNKSKNASATICRDEHV